VGRRKDKVGNKKDDRWVLYSVVDWWDLKNENKLLHTIMKFSIFTKS
jgi:hypothetical protein